MEDKDRESLKLFASEYLADLKQYLDHKLHPSNQAADSSNEKEKTAKPTTELASL